MCTLSKPLSSLSTFVNSRKIKGDDLPHLKAASLSPGKRKSSESGDVAAAPTSSPKVNSPPKSLPEANLGVDMLLARPAALYVRTRLYAKLVYICKASTHIYAKLLPIYMQSYILHFQSATLHHNSHCMTLLHPVLLLASQYLLDEVPQTNLIGKVSEKKCLLFGQLDRMGEAEGDHHAPSPDRINL